MHHTETLAAMWSLVLAVLLACVIVAVQDAKFRTHLLMVQRTNRFPESFRASKRSVATTLVLYTYLQQNDTTISIAAVEVDPTK